ncbi:MULTISPECIES: Ldh family oxidoreductase [unclassified Pseudomonas]|uniref:Ldh family oxidoreductase n=1 Tax=unclassified Pseudomonas TaxID=196821 RepID=UPI000B740387|nr:MULTISPECIES: Ldh family oxidoreductase [Pseudomonas]SNS91277.1 Malate/lactate/ureidoglycolate dehydrogenase, LDH2 family [Pseudomonas sp. LAMO17WK12:I8]SNY17895.1 Malate/lactate/ureidoglycolate dehydrogenase, LDH2 family [Pseudomonas sp. LAMO17WK12:I12]SNY19822.1 Malate/lactate/ureidoglycolate dehydrogenase, LDH2 family [Pseudomonas sp. LAMO17WK12:I11]SNY19854.1 Malate/lactate/ureidoglycolate dehydrogenase, LDH2 family [Pseudomonas sp. LAMO17WK12:I7]
MTQPTRCNVQALTAFVEQLFVKAGADSEVAQVVTRVLLEGELLGHRTHGLNLVSRYIDGILSGQVKARAQALEHVSDSGISSVFDGHYVLGPYCVSRALDCAAKGATAQGIGIAVVRRASHIGCLAAYLKPYTDQGLVAMVYSSDPSVALVCAHGGIDPVYTPNPIAAGVPTQGEPILLDVSMSTVTLGLVGQCRDAGSRLPHPVLVSNDGQLSDDPRDFFTNPPGSILPLGGQAFGHKGFALALLVEALTSGLAGHGRKDEPTQWGASATAVVIDPRFFGGLEAFTHETSFLGRLILASRPLDPERPVRLPGQAGLALRRQALAQGVSLSPQLMADLDRLAGLMELPTFSQ